METDDGHSQNPTVDTTLRVVLDRASSVTKHYRQGGFNDRDPPLCSRG